MIAQAVNSAVEHTIEVGVPPVNRPLWEVDELAYDWGLSLTKEQILSNAQRWHIRW